LGYNVRQNDGPLERICIPVRRPGERRDPVPSVSSARKQPCVYILASARNGTLYIGATSNLVQRVWQHKNSCVDGFTKQHRVHKLAWFEMHATMETATTREKALKQWTRSWKLELIEKSNPYWRDLYDDLA
jgi:putative endonuclease